MDTDGKAEASDTRAVSQQRFRGVYKMLVLSLLAIPCCHPWDVLIGKTAADGGYCLQELDVPQRGSGRSWVSEKLEPRTSTP